MKKILTLVLCLSMVLASVAVFASCGKADYKLGMGIVVDMTSSKAGNAQVDATVAAVVTDADGKIVKQDIAEMLFGHGVEYLPVYGQYGDPASSDYQSYENGFAGLNKDTVGNHVMISGATVSSTAVKTAMSEVFAAFEAIKGGTN